MSNVTVLTDLKETLKNLNQLYLIRLTSAKSVETILLNRIISRPKSQPAESQNTLKKHKEYEKIVRATLRQDSNHLRSICMGIQLRRHAVLAQIKHLENAESN